MLLPKDLVAASSTPLVLSILSQSDSYGYSIIEKVKELSDGEMLWADGMLYPILHRLEKKGYISSYWERSETGRKRKYYRLEKSGYKELMVQRENWQKLYEMLNVLNGGNPGYV